jgi:exonuclease III
MGVVLSWNVAGRVRSVAAQAAALAARRADVVALQEVRATALEAWRAELTRLGYVHLHHTPTPTPALPERRLGVLVAARRPLSPLPSPAIPWPERHAAARTALGEVHVLHAPISSKANRAKVLTLEAVTAALVTPRPHPVILVGDLNTPAYETREGELRSFARTRTGRLREGFDLRHDRAELGIVTDLQAAGFVDAFRIRHGFVERRDRSWVYAHGRMGYRIDHVLVRGAAVLDCDYEHAWRDAGLSDHSAIWARVRTSDPGPANACC